MQSFSTQSELFIVANQKPFKFDAGAAGNGNDGIVFFDDKPYLPLIAMAQAPGKVRLTVGGVPIVIDGDSFYKDASGVVVSSIVTNVTSLRAQSGVTDPLDLAGFNGGARGSLPEGEDAAFQFADGDAISLVAA